MRIFLFKLTVVSFQISDSFSLQIIMKPKKSFQKSLTLKFLYSYSFLSFINFLSKLLKRSMSFSIIRFLNINQNNFMYVFHLEEIWTIEKCIYLQGFTYKPMASNFSHTFWNYWNIVYNESLFISNALFIFIVLVDYIIRLSILMFLKIILPLKLIRKKLYTIVHRSFFENWRCFSF